MSNCNNGCENRKIEDFCGYSVGTLAYSRFSRLVEEHDAEVRADERKKAEIDFQNSDYWNDYLAKVIADARADERREISEILNSPGDAETIVMMLTNYMVRHTIRDALKNKEQKDA